MRTEQQPKPELLPELGAEVLGELVVVLQAGQQEATALVQQNSLSWSQRRLLRVRQNQHHLLYLVTEEGQLQRREDRSGLKFEYTNDGGDGKTVSHRGNL